MARSKRLKEDPIVRIADVEGERGADLEVPLVPLRQTVIFPHMALPIQVGRAKSIKAVEEASKNKRTVFLVAQRNDVDEPEADDFHKVGTVAIVGHVLRMPDGSLQVLVQGQTRAILEQVAQTEPYFTARVHTIVEESKKTLEIEALMRVVLGQYETLIKLNENVPEEVLAALRNVDAPGHLADMAGYVPGLSTTERQTILESFEPIERLRLVSTLLSRHVEINELRNKIQAEVSRGIDKTQREYHLREQLKAIQRELGEISPETAVVQELKDKVESAGMPDEVKEKALHEIERLAMIPSMSPEVAVIRNYVDWLVALPWAKETTDNLELQAAKRVLDEDHYGLPKVKDRILEYIAVRKLAEKMRTPIVCFVGPPGVGKTSLGKSIARALGRKFVRMSLGGIRDEAEIRGHRRTYVGALPGRIIQGIRNAGSRNPVFMLDEIDKVGADFRGDPSSALLEALEPEQNTGFSDHYLEVPFDLSRVMFITTANLLDPILPPLRDRMEVIEIAGYTEDEKLGIAKQFLVPKQTSQHGLTTATFGLTSEALKRIIRDYTREAGVRNLEREIGSVCRKVARTIAEGKKPPRKIGADAIPRYLGAPRFTHGVAEEEDEVGVATGVAWTSAGGDLLSIEVNVMEGRPDLILTGHLGQVMQESARAALTYARSRADKLAISPEIFDNRAIHIHVPAGAIPKDGPSAGITIATALVSALTNRPIRHDVAMTGEVTLRGRVLPIGGLKEKMLAAHRAGIKTFILPERNRMNLEDVPPKVLENLRLVFADHMDQVLEVALAPRQEPSIVAVA